MTHTPPELTPTQPPLTFDGPPRRRNPATPPGSSQSCGPCSRSASPLLLAPAAAQARVVVIAADRPEAALLDVGTNTVTARVALPGRARAVATTADGSRAYVAAGRGVTAIDLGTRAVAGRAALRGTPPRRHLPRRRPRLRDPRPRARRDRRRHDAPARRDRAPPPRPRARDHARGHARGGDARARRRGRHRPRHPARRGGA